MGEIKHKLRHPIRLATGSILLFISSFGMGIFYTLGFFEINKYSENIMVVSSIAFVLLFLISMGFLCWSNEEDKKQ